MKKLKKKNLEKKSRKGTDGLMAAGSFRFECVLRLISTHPDCGTDFKVIRPRCEPGRGWTGSAELRPELQTQNVNGHSPALNVFWMPRHGHWASRGSISQRQERRSNPAFFKARTRWMTERIPSSERIQNRPTEMTGSNRP